MFCSQSNECGFLCVNTTKQPRQHGVCKYNQMKKCKPCYGKNHFEKKVS